MDSAARLVQGQQVAKKVATVLQKRVRNALWLRGNDFVKHASEGLQPVLHFDSEIVLDGRKFDRPVNYRRSQIRKKAST